MEGLRVGVTGGYGDTLLNPLTGDSSAAGKTVIALLHNNIENLR